MERFIPASFPTGHSPRPFAATPPIPAPLYFVCLLFLAGVIPSCSRADPFFFDETVTTTLYLPSIQVARESPTKAGYEGYSDISRIDVFVFNDDELRRLDSYTSFGRPETPYLSIRSGAGDKLVIILANCSAKSLSYQDFSSYDALEGLTWELKDEDPSCPVMSGECHINAGEDGYTPVQLVPLMSNVCLDFIKCDFSGRGYRSTTLTNAYIYLTNISGSSEVLRHDGFKLTQLENAGGLDRDYLASMSHPEMIYRTITPGHWAPVNLYCYPNDAAEGILGSPHTRLVVQGDIDGETWYYPIEINQEGFGFLSGNHGLGRNIKYSYNILITRKGSRDPDTLTGPEEVVGEGWIQLHPGNFLTGTIGDKLHVWCEVYPDDTALDISREDLDYDAERGIYTYEMDEDGHGVTLTLAGNGTGMFTIDAGPPVNDGFLVIVVVNP